MIGDRDAEARFIITISHNWGKLRAEDKQKLLAKGVSPYHGAIRVHPPDNAPKPRREDAAAAVDTEASEKKPPESTVDEEGVPADAVFSIDERPYGIPRGVSFEDYKEDPICKLSLYNYKVEASVGTSTNSLTPVLSVFDTGAGPNIIRADILPDEVLSSLQTSREIANLSSASQHKLDTLGIAYLYINVSGYICRQPFVVAKQLSADMLLGTTFTDKIDTLVISPCADWLPFLTTGQLSPSLSVSFGLCNGILTSLSIFPQLNVRPYRQR